MRRKLPVWISVGLAIGLSLSACSSGGQTSPAGQDSATATSSAPASSGGEIGVVQAFASDVAVSAMVSGIKAEAEKLGYSVSLVDANGSVDAANSAIQNLVAKNVKAIIVTVFSSEALSTGLAAAKEAGVPVLIQGGGLADGVAYEINDVLATPLSEELVKQLPQDAHVLALNYRGGRPCQLREEGFDQMSATRTDLVIDKQETPVPGQTEAARAATLAWLTANEVEPGGKSAIWVCFDDQALGAVSALKEQGLNPGDVWVYSTNGTGDALQAVKDGWITVDMWIDFTAAGTKLAQAIPEILAGGDSWQQISEPAPYVLVDKSNVDQYLDKSNG